MLSGPYSAVTAMISVSGEATAPAASRIFAVIEAVVLGLTRSSFMARMVPYTIPSPASVPCLMRRRRSRVMKNRLTMMTRNDTPVVTVPSA